MKTVNIHEAKTQLSKLVEEASKGEPFVIAKAGKPLVKVTALGAPTGAQVRRPALWRARSQCPTTLTESARTRLSECSMAVDETPSGHASAPLAAGEPERLSTQARGLIDDPDNETSFQCG